MYVGMNQSKSRESDRGTCAARLTGGNDTLLEKETQNVMNINAAGKANRRDGELSEIVQLSGFHDCFEAAQRVARSSPKLWVRVLLGTFRLLVSLSLRLRVSVVA